MKAKDSILINDAASKERKKESDEKINLMEIALSEAKLNNQIANNASALKSNEAEKDTENKLNETKQVLMVGDAMVFTANTTNRNDYEEIIFFNKSDLVEKKEISEKLNELRDIVRKIKAIIILSTTSVSILIT